MTNRRRFLLGAAAVAATATIPLSAAAPKAMGFDEVVLPPEMGAWQAWPGFRPTTLVMSPTTYRQLRNHPAVRHAMASGIVVKPNQMLPVGDDGQGLSHRDS